MSDRSVLWPRLGRLLLLALIGCCIGCAGGCRSLRNGMLNVVGDAGDIARLDVGASVGTDMGAHVMVTKLARLKSYSCDGVYHSGFNVRNLGVWREDREDWAIGPLGEGSLRADGHWIGNPRHAVTKGGAFLTESSDEIGLGAHLFLVGVRAGVRPWQAVDLLAGLVGLDPAGDNLSWSQRQALRKKAEKSATK